MSDESKSTESTEAPEAGAKPDALGEAGKKALDSERRARRDAEKALREAQDRIDSFERRELLREVAASKDLTEDQAARLNGTTKDELEADADALLKAFKSDAKSTSTGKPQERLRSGSSSDDDEPAFDPNKLADQIFDRGI